MKRAANVVYEKAQGRGSVGSASVPLSLATVCGMICNGKVLRGASVVLRQTRRVNGRRGLGLGQKKSLGEVYGGSRSSHGP